MTVILENERYLVKINKKGAELTQFFDKEKQIEYVWNANPLFWARHAPILFPHVGRVKEDTLVIKGKSYPSGQHGFARDMLFCTISSTDTRAVFQLSENEETLARYPYKFQLSLSYELTENKLKCGWKVENTNDEKMFYGIGGHPAFNVPLSKELNFEDYYFEIRPKQERTRIPFVVPMLDPKNSYKENTDKIAINQEKFHNDALVYETNGYTEIAIKSDKSPHAITMSYENIPYVGLWSMYPAKAPFVCIEPWWSYADTPEDTGNFEEKHSVMSLAPQEIFETNYTLTVA